MFSMIGHIHHIKLLKIFHYLKKINGIVKTANLAVFTIPLFYSKTQNYLTISAAIAIGSASNSFSIFKF